MNSSPSPRTKYGKTTVSIYLHVLPYSIPLPPFRGSYHPEFCLYCSLGTPVCSLYCVYVNTWVIYCCIFVFYLMCGRILFLQSSGVAFFAILLSRLRPLVAVILLNRILLWPHCISRHVGYLQGFFHFPAVLLWTFSCMHPGTCEQEFLLGAHTYVTVELLGNRNQCSFVQDNSMLFS